MTYSENSPSASFQTKNSTCKIGHGKQIMKILIKKEVEINFEKSKFLEILFYSIKNKLIIRCHTIKQIIWIYYLKQEHMFGIIIKINNKL